MKKIFIAGAGLSSGYLIKYLLDHSFEYDWKISVGDIDIDRASEKVANHPNGTVIHFDAFDEIRRKQLIGESDIVISMLPADLHYLLTGDCISLKKNMITASYVSDAMLKFDEEAKKSHIILLNEVGVDPGIDHMSAMSFIDNIKEKGGYIVRFESYTGGLLYSSIINNPWNHKFTWNPKNFVLLGKDGAKYLEKGEIRNLPYHKIYCNCKRLKVKGVGDFEVYPNRDSLKYIDLYGLQGILTLKRGTMRHPGFCDAWNNLVKLGATNNNDVYNIEGKMTYKDFTRSLLSEKNHLYGTLETRLAAHLGIDENGEIMKKIKWLGLFDEIVIPSGQYTPAMIIGDLLSDKWKLAADDKDMVVMQHIIEYKMNNKSKKTVLNSFVTGENSNITAMSMTVGLPVGIATRLILENKVHATGVTIPVTREFYKPILQELKQYGIIFQHEESESDPDINKI
jgi:saccharopine dehydrogenase-like NADP-dependent oxidoreductase